MRIIQNVSLYRLHFHWNSSADFRLRQRRRGRGDRKRWAIVNVGKNIFQQAKI